MCDVKCKRFQRKKTECCRHNKIGSVNHSYSLECIYHKFPPFDLRSENIVKIIEDNTRDGIEKNTVIPDSSIPSYEYVSHDQCSNNEVKIIKEEQILSNYLLQDKETVTFNEETVAINEETVTSNEETAKNDEEPISFDKEAITPQLQIKEPEIKDQDIPVLSEEEIYPDLQITQSKFEDKSDPPLKKICNLPNSFEKQGTCITNTGTQKVPVPILYRVSKVLQTYAKQQKKIILNVGTQTEPVDVIPISRQKRSYRRNSLQVQALVNKNIQVPSQLTNQKDFEVVFEDISETKATEYLSGRTLFLLSSIVIIVMGFTYFCMDVSLNDIHLIGNLIIHKLLPKPKEVTLYEKCLNMILSFLSNILHFEQVFK